MHLARSYSKAEHLDWCKRRACRHLAEHALAKAVASMIVDVSRDPDTEQLIEIGRVVAGIEAARTNDSSQVRDWIESFR